MDSKKVFKKVSAIVLPILGAIILKMLDNKEPEKYNDEWFATISDTELVRDLNHNSFFPNNFYARTARRNNPYTAYFLPIEWHNRLDLTGISSNNKLNMLFAPILTNYFPDFQFKHFARFTWNYLFTYMGNGHNLENTMDFLLRFAWWRVHHKLESSYYDPEYRHSISRHIAWCEYEHKRVCLKFNFDCHSSVNCPFYRESQLKRQGIT